MIDSVAISYELLKVFQVRQNKVTNKGRWRFNDLKSEQCHGQRTAFSDRLLGFKPLFYYLLAVGPRASSFVSLSFNFLICKMRCQ